MAVVHDKDEIAVGPLLVLIAQAHITVLEPRTSKAIDSKPSVTKLPLANEVRWTRTIFFFDKKLTKSIFDD